MTDFFNTTNCKNPELKSMKSRCITQNDNVLSIFRKSPKIPFTPFEIHKMFPANVPLTSIRRSISVLTRKGYLKKTKCKQMGGYGAMNYLWTLRID